VRRDTRHGARAGGGGALAALAAAALAGCGDEPLSRADENAVSRATGDISFYCPTDAAPERPAPPHIVRGVDRVIAVYRKDPDALYESGTEYERPISDLVEGLERQVRWCDPRLADRMKEEL
jgi:hypothetical protein